MKKAQNTCKPEALLHRVRRTHTSRISQVARAYHDHDMIAAHSAAILWHMGWHPSEVLKLNSGKYFRLTATYQGTVDVFTRYLPLPLASLSLCCPQLECSTQQLLSTLVCRTSLLQPLHDRLPGETIIAVTVTLLSISCPVPILIIFIFILHSSSQSLKRPVASALNYPAEAVRGVSPGRHDHISVTWHRS